MAKCFDCGSGISLGKGLRLDEIKEVSLLCVFHFKGYKVEDYSCEKCADFKQSRCSGANKKGHECWLCMVEHYRTTGGVLMDQKDKERIFQSIED